MAFDSYLQIAEIAGDSTDSAHTDWIEILAFNFSIDQATGGSSSGSGSFAGGAANVSDFFITKRLDAASANLQLFCLRASYISEMVLECCRALGDKTCFYKVTMNNAIVSSYAPTGTAAGNDLMPTEQVGFRFDKIQVEYTATDATTGAAGSTFTSNWSLVDGAPF